MSDTDDLMAKLNDVLNDEESMKQIKELAGALSAESGSGNADGSFDISRHLGMNDNGNEAKEQNTNDNSNPLGNLDISKLMQVKSIMEQSTKDDKNIALLLALKPHLKDEKQAKVDSLIKIFKLLKLLPLLRESGILGGDLLGII